MAYVYVDDSRCNGCGACVAVCPTEAIALVDGTAVIDQDACEGCEECLRACGHRAILSVIDEVEDRAVRTRTAPEAPVTSWASAPPSTTVKPQLLPLISGTLLFLGREVVPRVLPRFLEVLDRGTSEALRSAPENAVARGGRAGGRRSRMRRRGR